MNEIYLLVVRVIPYVKNNRSPTIILEREKRIPIHILNLDYRQSKTQKTYRSVLLFSTDSTLSIPESLSRLKPANAWCSWLSVITRKYKLKQALPLPESACSYNIVKKLFQFFDLFNGESQTFSNILYGDTHIFEFQSRFKFFS